MSREAESTLLLLPSRLVEILMLNSKPSYIRPYIGPKKRGPPLFS